MNVLLIIVIALLSNGIMFFYFKRLFKKERETIKTFVNGVQAQSHVYFNDIDNRIADLEEKIK